MDHLGIPALLLLFAGAAVATWIAGVWLAKATDVLDYRFGLGETIGGMVLLSITGILLRKPRRYWGLGPDSWAALLIYILGTRGFMLVSG